jgi:CheY-like chemotaxis protein
MNQPHAQRVLVVDDDHALREPAGRLSGSQRLVVDGACDGVQMHERMAQHCPTRSCST